MVSDRPEPRVFRASTISSMAAGLYPTLSSADRLERLLTKLGLVAGEPRDGSPVYVEALRLSEADDGRGQP